MPDEAREAAASPGSAVGRHPVPTANRDEVVGEPVCAIVPEGAPAIGDDCDNQADHPAGKLQLEHKVPYHKGLVMVIPLAELLRLVGQAPRRRDCKEFITLAPVEIENPLDPGPGGEEYFPPELVERLHRQFGTDKISLVVVPSGFKTDFASIPWPLTMLARRIGPWTRAAVLHDWGYYSHEIDAKAFWDRLFRKAMREDGVGAGRAWLMYRAVALFGGGAWKGSYHRQRKEYNIHFLAERLAAEHGLLTGDQMREVAW